MIQNSSFCQIAGHEMLKITHICTYKQCQQATRFKCQECNRKSIHIHEAQEKYMRLEDLQIYLDTKVKARIEQQKKEAQRIPEFIQDINQVIKQLQHIVKQQESYLFNLQEIGKAYDLTNKKLLTLSSQQMNYLINMEDGNIDYFQTQNDLQKIILQLQKMNKECFASSYQIHNTLKTNHVYSPSISQNEQYLGFIYPSRCLKINKLKSNQPIMNKKFCDQIWQAKFSTNSKFIFSINYMKKFRQIQIKNNCKLIFSRYVDIETHSPQSECMEIENSQIVTYDDDKITIYDLTRRRLIFIINFEPKYICNCIEFDKFNNLILVSIDGEQIKFYDRNNGNLVFTGYYDSQIEVNQIQLINRSQNLLGNDQGWLKLWSINYQYKRFDLIKQFNLHIDYFKSVYQDQRIIIRNSNQLIVVDNNLNIIYDNKIEGRDKFKFIHFYELETMNYILIFQQSGVLVIWKNINKV